MKTNNIIYIILLASVIVGCRGSKKQVLGSKEEVNAENLATKTSYETSLVMDTVIPNPGIKYKEVRKINPSSPPVKLNLIAKLEEKELRLSDYYSSVKYVKLKHPFAEQEKSFLGNSKISIQQEIRGSISMSRVNSFVFLTSKNIIAGDGYFGYHCYDLDGNFIYTITAMDELPEYKKNNNEVFMKENSLAKRIYSFSVLDDNCLIYTAKNRKVFLDFHNTTEKKTYLSRPYYGGMPMLISPEIFVSFQYYLYATVPLPMMFSYEIKGDTLCSFINYNTLVKPKRSPYSSAEGGNYYYYNNALSFRQAYNDTIYRFTSPSELTAVYILDLGSQRIDINTGLFEERTGKMIHNEWLETEKFAFIVHTENYDSPNNRKNNSVKFFYSFYDKKEQKLYRIPYSSYPEDFILSNEIEGGMPLSTGQAQVNGEKLYSGYTKAQLEGMTKNKNFASLPFEQQEKVKSWINELSEGEMLLMILE